VTPHQTVTVNALSVTLERVRISPSETILEGTTKGTVPSSPQATFTLNAAGHSPDSLASASFGFGGESTPFSAEYYDGLLGQHGKWTFDISGPGEGSWEFRFSVP